ncbi:sensor histidine kinase [Streptomyces sp. L7]
MKRQAEAPSPAVARLRRTRRLVTLLFASTTAACLVVLAVVAIRIDAASRRSGLDHEVGSRAGGAVAGGLVRRGRAASGAAARGRTRPGRPGVGRPAGGAREEADLAERRTRTVLAARRGPVGRGLAQRPGRTGNGQVSASAAKGGRLRWAAAPVWDGDRIGAAVLVGTELARSEHDHDLLVRWLALGCTALVCCAAAVGHVLSGRAMRPALRGLGQQEQFLAEAAHELRTPLATLRLVVERNGSSDEALRLVDRLSRLVTGLLARARLESGAQRVELVPLRLDQLVETTVEELPDHQSVTVTAEPVVVRGDPDLLAQAVRNLVENAQRHGGPAGSPVEVSVTPGLVTVRDHGDGVPLADRERVFARGVTGTGPGTGAGLAIVRWVAGLHHGTARLTDAPGGGLLAELRLPADPPPASSSSSHEGPGTVGA